MQNSPVIPLAAFVVAITLALVTIVSLIVIAWPVVAAALGVLVIGVGALWLASREPARSSDP